jgi:predicted PhzF superfamily epimerase YddE/YHI9
MTEVYKFQVFVNESGKFGNPGSLFLDEGRQIDDAERIAITAKIGHDETVFINNLETNDLSIYHSLGEVDFAGSVLVGVVWQLGQLKSEPITHLHCAIGDIPVWQEGELSWLRTKLEGNLGNWEYEQLDSPEVVEAIDVADTASWKKMVWAWINKDRGLIRARTFASSIGIPEVQGNGSGSLNLADQLQRSIQIIHGDGSVIYARPSGNDSAELGGRVIAVDN